MNEDRKDTLREGRREEVDGIWFVTCKWVRERGNGWVKNNVSCTLLVAWRDSLQYKQWTIFSCLPLSHLTLYDFFSFFIFIPSIHLSLSLIVFSSLVDLSIESTSYLVYSHFHNDMDWLCTGLCSIFHFSFFYLLFPSIVPFPLTSLSLPSLLSTFHCFLSDHPLLLLSFLIIVPCSFSFIHMVHSLISIHSYFVIIWIILFIYCVDESS